MEQLLLRRCGSLIQASEVTQRGEVGVMEARERESVETQTQQALAKAEMQTSLSTVLEEDADVCYRSAGGDSEHTDDGCLIAASAEAGAAVIQDAEALEWGVIVRTAALASAAPTSASQSMECVDFLTRSGDCSSRVSLKGRSGTMTRRMLLESLMRQEE